MTDFPPPERLSRSKSRNRDLHGGDLAGDNPRFDSRPPMIQVEPTSRCNLSCPICARNYFDRDRNPPGEMPVAVFERFAPALEFAEDLVIGGYGEPLMAEMYWKILEAGKRYGCRVETISNGTLLFGDRAQRIVSMGLDALAVSVDAACDETMRTMRGVALQPVIDNLMGLSETKRFHRKILPVVEITFTASQVNISDLPPMIDIAEQAGARRVRVQLQKFYTTGQTGQSLLHVPEQAIEWFEKATDRARALGIELVLPSLLGEKRQCLQPFELLFVRWNGTVMGCCSAVFENDHYNFPVGDIRKNTLEEIWNAPAILKYREALLAGDDKALPSVCRQCAFRKDDLDAQYRFLDEPSKNGEDDPVV